MIINNKEVNYSFSKTVIKFVDPLICYKAKIYKQQPR